MKTFTQVRSHAVILPIDDVDTDQIIPARFLKITDKAGLGDKLFHDWRYLPSGKPNPDFPLNRPQTAGAKILLTGDNFGCGSSREHAPWALAAWGLRAIVSTSFADIFRNNALENGLLPVVVEPRLHADLVDRVRAQPAVTLEVDLPRQRLCGPRGLRATFPIDPFSKRCLVGGLDQLGYLQGLEDRITEYETRRT